eukprot:12386106-Alexandrium_andersonii.AAC.1
MRRERRERCRRRWWSARAPDRGERCRDRGQRWRGAGSPDAHEGLRRKSRGCHCHHSPRLAIPSHLCDCANCHRTG